MSQNKNQEIEKDLQKMKLKHTKTDFSSSSDDDDDQDIVQDAEVAQKLGKVHNSGKKKMAISAEAYGNYNRMEEFKPRLIQKNNEQIEQIRSVLKLSFMFSSLEERDLEIVIRAMNIVNYAPGDFIIKQGDDGAELFIVGSGSLKCEKIMSGADKPTFLKNYCVGEVFGELSLMYNAPRAASIIAIVESACFSLDRDTFNNIVKTAAIKRRELYESFLKKVDILAELEGYERAKLCDCLETQFFKKNEFVIKEGEDGDRFYFIQEGTADAFKNENGIEKKVFEYKENDYFGELALLHDEKRKASIQVTSEVMRVAFMNKLTFKRILGPVENILKRNAEKYKQYLQN